jgi:hypothetical protein
VGAWLLALALVAAQAFALLHGVVHGGHAGPAPHAHGLAHAQAHQPGHAHEGHGDAHAHGLIERLFGAHHDDLDCRLYDQLGHADAAPALLKVVLPLALPASAFGFLSGAFIARRAALFEARGPPSVR